ncbi:MULTISPECIES: DUF1672 family protein [unclassified Psychrobacillus]|uniref:DUF1672 family protein n=1 Tax=unclassified Psychrobacillus TaxID=2636677 RepID=UPI00146A6D60|nr:DUF1672 family protein [Psychrobacillus sp. BL-248-WT-3]NME06738.1 DUF1672 family protein [Psychrobacillus sp. BL-248-WT-3]
MKNNKMAVAIVSTTLLLGGCNMEVESKKESEIIGKGDVALDSSSFVSVQDYTGEEYALQDGEETDKIAEANREEIEQAVKDFFLNNYKTEVKIHNIVGAVDGASVFVESIREPHFYTFAIVPIDVENEKVEVDKVWSQEGQIEDAITTGLYAMIHDQEFSTLDNYLEKLTEENPLVGTRMEAVEKVGANGYATPYYYTSAAGEYFTELYNKYIENPTISKEELKSSMKKYDLNSNLMLITITLYMKESDTDPDEVLYDKIVSDIEQMEGLPRGSYSVILHDNLINAEYADGSKKSSLNKTALNEIRKE